MQIWVWLLSCKTSSVLSDWLRWVCCVLLVFQLCAVFWLAESSSVFWFADTHAHSLWFTDGLKITRRLSEIHVELFWNKRLCGCWGSVVRDVSELRDTCVHAFVRARAERWASRKLRWLCWTRKEVNEIQSVWEGVWDVYWEAVRIKVHLFRSN